MYLIDWLLHRFLGSLLVVENIIEPRAMTNHGLDEKYRMFSAASVA